MSAMMDVADDPLCTWGINLCWMSTFSSISLYICRRFSHSLALAASVKISKLVCWNTANCQQQKQLFTRLVTSFSLYVTQMTIFSLTVNSLTNYISHNENTTLA